MQHAEDSLTTPLTSTSQFIQAGLPASSSSPATGLVSPPPADDDDDLDEEAIPSFSHPGMPATPGSAVPDKGKGRAMDQLASPAGGSQFPRTPLSGNIGSAPASSVPQSARRTVGGVQVETRYVAAVNDLYIRIQCAVRNTGIDTLDEPVLTTIVSISASPAAPPFDA